MSKVRISEVSTPTLHILDKALKTELKNRQQLPADTYTVSEEFTLSVDGRVNVFPDEEYTPTTNIPLKAAFALFVRYSGVTGQAAMNALMKAMKEAADLDREGKIKAFEEMADLDKAWQTVTEGLGELPKKTRKGKVTVKGIVE